LKKKLSKMLIATSSMGSSGKNRLTSQSSKYSISKMTLSGNGYVNRGGTKHTLFAGYLSKNLSNRRWEKLIQLIVIIKKIII
jgi:hypothetical protein